MKENKKILLVVGISLLIWAILSAIFQNTLISIVLFISFLAVAVLVISVRILQVVHQLKKDARENE